eukprot:CAMPEP_0113936012 /NCGR_PEP_ID=MMETSP1339-20121228/3019_1 /TAXON_ID=94617 /ORGANISM="Fibrocapsa japonica" /LENGTH=181 /DNA_ID=CAMNT_0000938337 /DNA_START=92 /DNA_END=637 /DNA_ORIENTATION=- /assembly_acc=CAM_ASM_000762
MRLAVQLPSSASLNEWLCVNTVDFFNEVSLLYGIVMDDTSRFTRPGDGFPAGFEYLWSPGAHSKPVKCSAPEYVDHVMTWVEGQLNDDSKFPSQPDLPYPENFTQMVQTVFKRLFRVFAIIYCSHFGAVEQLGAAPHLNTSFKHFLFFCLEFSLINQRELEPLIELVRPLQEEFDNSPTEI